MTVRMLHLDGYTADDLQGGDVNIVPDLRCSGVKFTRRDPIYSLLREAVIASVSNTYTELDSVAYDLCSDDREHSSVECIHEQIANILAKDYSIPNSASVQPDDLYRVSITTEELWVKSCEVPDFLTSAVVAYIKLCIYRFGDSGAFSDALNTIII